MKATRNYVLALVMGLLALVQAVSGFVLWLALPREAEVAGEKPSYGQGRLAHYPQRSAVALAVIVIIHVIFHWGWIVQTTKSYFSQK